jgi:hypothetical protein
VPLLNLHRSRQPGTQLLQRIAKLAEKPPPNRLGGKCIGRSSSKRERSPVRCGNQSGERSESCRARFYKIELEGRAAVQRGDHGQAPCYSIQREHQADSSPSAQTTRQLLRILLGHVALDSKPWQVSCPAYYCYGAGPPASLSRFCEHLVPQRLVTEGGHQPGEVVQRLNSGEECLEVHPRGAPDVAELHGMTQNTGRSYQNAARCGRNADPDS